MKKYKLLIKYPCIPETMEIGNIVVWNEPMNAYSHDKTLDIFCKKDVEGFPELWEKIVELEVPLKTNFKVKHDSRLVYTIDSIYKDNNVKVTWSRPGNTGSTEYTIEDVNEYFKKGIWTTVETVLTEDGILLHKGDPYYFIWIESPYRKQCVNKIYYVKAYSPEPGTTKGENAVWFSTRKAAEEWLDEKALFTTEDGVRKFAGDSWFYVKEGSDTLAETNTLNYNGKSKRPVKRFHSQDVANEYIRHNKKEFSIQDIQDAFESIPAPSAYRFSFFKYLHDKTKD